MTLTSKSGLSCIKELNILLRIFILNVNLTIPYAYSMLLSKPVLSLSRNKYRIIYFFEVYLLVTLHPLKQLHYLIQKQWHQIFPQICRNFLGIINIKVVPYFVPILNILHECTEKELQRYS